MSAGRAGSRHRSSLAGVLLASLWLSGVAGAQDAPGADGPPSGPLPSAARAPRLVDIQATVGFSGTFRLGRWTPVVISIRNRGRDLVGDLDLVVTGGDELRRLVRATVHRRALDLPGGSRKRFRFTVLLDSFSRPLTVRVSEGGAVVAERSIDLRRGVTGAQLLLVLSRDADLDYLNDRAGERRRVVYLHPELLPDRWQAFDGISAVITHGVSLEALSSAQYGALERWLARGGRLAVSGGPDYALLRTPRLARLLPGVPVGMVRLDAAAVAGALGAPLHAPRPFEVNRVPVHQGHVLRAAGSVPLVIERDLGEGTVHQLTFDIAREPFDRWQGMRPLWVELLGLGEPRVDGLDRQAMREPGPVGELVRGARGYFPGHGELLAFLALYLGVLASGYRAAASGWGSRWLVPWMTWAAPAVFAPAAYLVLGPGLFPMDASAIVVSTVESHRDGRFADLALEIGLFSNRAEPLRLEYEGAAPAFRPVPQMGDGGAAEWVLGTGRPDYLAPANRAGYVLHRIDGHDVVPYALRGSVVESASGLDLAVENDSGHDLDAAWLVHRGRAHPLGAIPAGAALERRVDRQAGALDLQRVTWRSILAGAAERSGPREAAAQRVIDRWLEELGAHAEASHHEAQLVALAASPLRVVGASARWRREELGLTLVRLPATPRQPVGDAHGPREPDDESR